MSSEPIIRVRNLSKSFPIYASPSDRLKQFIFPRIQRLLGLEIKSYYRTFNALSDISFEVKRGETVGVIGRNGAGKSTLLQILCGTLFPTNGTVEIQGRVAALLELGAGFNGEYTGRENVYMNARILGLSDLEINARFEEIIRFADIGEHLDQPVKTYSSGMFVRLAFAVVAHVNADVLIIDEALAVGDTFFNQKCMRLLEDFKKTGTLIFVTHDANALKSICRRAIWIDKGNIFADADTKSVSENYLASTYSDHRDNSANQSIVPSIPAHSFGNRKITIEEVDLTVNGAVPHRVKGGEQISIKMKMLAHEKIATVICGFNLKNKLGQVIFGCNTLEKYAAGLDGVEPSKTLLCIFSFKIPALTSGIYYFDVAVAEGNSNWHQQLHWIFDAAAIEFDSNKKSTGVLLIECNIIDLSIN
jgi:lipopolysaccharide transport system ATP-binding protein